VRPLQRLLVLAGIAGLTFVLAFVLRDVAQKMVIIPLAYLWWLGSLAYLVIPQFIKWTVLVVCVCAVLVWQLTPERQAPHHFEAPHRQAPGAVELLAVWIHKAGGSNYYKWQLAHRLGRTGRELQVLWGRRAGERSPGPPVGDYLEAGIDHSFVEYARVRNWFQRREVTPLDMDPSKAVEYLESQTELGGETHARGL
jgi:hypothetical protein